MVLTRIPLEVTRGVTQACATLGLTSSPEYLPIDPAPDARANHCVLNVAAAVSRGSGRRILGWKVTEWQGVLVEFIGHAVLEMTGGSRACVTPDRYGETRILFVLDDRLSFDSTDAHARMPYQLVPSTPHEDVAAFIRIETECQNSRRKLPPRSGTVRISGPDAARYLRLREAQRVAIRDIALRTWPDAKGCVCDSGKPFAKCCKVGMRFEKRGERA
jgi:hypothetical protein